MRIRMAVIDDEVLVRKGIISSVDWDRHGVDIAGEATDGISGMELVRRTKPHIVLTDIRMPHVNGLELIRMIKSELPSSRILILSVLEDFQTVREALRLGVVDYVQKLLMTPEALLAAVLQIKQSIEAEPMPPEATPEGGLGVWLSGADAAPFDSLFTDGTSCILGKIMLGEREDSALAEPAFSPARATGDDDCKTVWAWLRQSPEPALNTARIAPDKDGACWALIPRHDDGVSRERVVYALRQLAELCAEAGLVLTAGLSQPFAEPKGRLAAREQANVALWRRFYKGDGVVYVYREEDRQPKRDGHFISNELLKSYVNGLRIDGDEASLLAWNRLFPEEADESFSVEAIREAIYLWLSSVMLALEERGEQLVSDSTEPSLFEQVRLIDTYPRLREWCLRLHEAVRLTFGKAQPQHRDEIRRAMEYTRSHYRDPIKVKDVADWVNLSENYFSYLFAKEAGRPFVQYLQETRIEQAKELLRDGKLKWHEVTEKVGFESPKYFTKVFKKYNGITPMQYAREHRSWTTR